MKISAKQCQGVSLKDVWSYQCWALNQCKLISACFPACSQTWLWVKLLWFAFLWKILDMILDILSRFNIPWFFFLILPNIHGHQKTLSLNLRSCFWKHLVIPHKKKKTFLDHYPNICLSKSNDQLSVYELKPFTRGVLITHLMMFWRRSIFKRKPISCFPQVKSDVLRAAAQAILPMVIEKCGPLGFFFPLTSFPSSHLATQLPLPGTISPPATGNPPVCWKASLSGTQQPFQTDMWFGPDGIWQASHSFWHSEMTSDWFRKEMHWQKKNVYALSIQHVKPYTTETNSRVLLGNSFTFLGKIETFRIFQLNNILFNSYTVERNI